MEDFLKWADEMDVHSEAIDFLINTPNEVIEQANEEFEARMKAWCDWVDENL